MTENYEIVLGFVEKPERPLVSRIFPSKVGGKPAWLDPEHLPAPERMRCGVCARPLTFLLQIYAPLDTPTTFHRTLFVFCCRDAACHKQPAQKCFRVLRDQLARENAYYRADPPDPTASHCEPLPNAAPLCEVCGCLAPSKCSRCKVARYCGREHQVADWRAGHAEQCALLQKAAEEGCVPPQQRTALARLLFPEFELKNETEDVKEEKGDEDEAAGKEEEEEELRKYAALANGLAMQTLGSAEDFPELLQDKPFLRFQRRVSHYPEQVISAEGQATPADIPPCPLCGAARTFEFQIMPQLLYYLKVDKVGEDSLDWGTLVVYTCPASCTPKEGSGYVEEFIWRQNFTLERTRLK